MSSLSCGQSFYEVSSDDEDGFVKIEQEELDDSCQEVFEDGNNDEAYGDVNQLEGAVESLNVDDENDDEGSDTTRKVRIRGKEMKSGPQQTKLCHYRKQDNIRRYVQANSDANGNAIGPHNHTVQNPPPYSLPTGFNTELYPLSVDYRPNVKIEYNSTMQTVDEARPQVGVSMKEKTATPGFYVDERNLRSNRRLEPIIYMPSCPSMNFSSQIPSSTSQYGCSQSPMIPVNQTPSSSRDHLTSPFTSESGSYDLSMGRVQDEANSRQIYQCRQISGPPPTLRPVTTTNANWRPEIEIAEKDKVLMIQARVFMASKTHEELLSVKLRDLVQYWPILHAYLGTLYCRNLLYTIRDDMQQLLWRVDLSNTAMIRSLLRFGARLCAICSSSGNNWLHHVVPKITQVEPLRQILQICQDEQPDGFYNAKQMLNYNGQRPVELMSYNLFKYHHILLLP